VRPALLRHEDHQDVRDYAASQGLKDEEALKQGLQQKAANS